MVNRWLEWTTIMVACSVPPKRNYCKCQDFCLEIEFPSILVNPLRTGFQCAVWAWQLREIQAMNDITLKVLEHHVLLQLSLYLYSNVWFNFQT